MSTSTGQASTRAITKHLALVNGLNVIVLTGAFVLTQAHGNYLRLDPGGATRTVTLPAEATSSGMWFMIRNGADAAEDLTVQDDTPTLIETCERGEIILYMCDGSSWFSFPLKSNEVVSGGIKTDTVSEATAGAGVTVDGVLMKDGGIVMADGAAIDADIVNEATAGAGVTLDGVLLKDSQVTTDVINEKTGAAGVTADGVLLKDGAVSGAREVAGTTPVAITGAVALVLADSGGIFSVAQSSAYDIDVPDPTTGPGTKFRFYLTAPGAFDVTITALGGATFVGTIVLDASVIPATGSTLTFSNGNAALGDYIEFTSISTSLWHVRAVSSDAGGITVA